MCTCTKEAHTRNASSRRCVASAASRNVPLDFFRFITEDWKSNGDVRKQSPPGTCTTSFRFNTAICFVVPRNGNISAQDKPFTEMTDASEMQGSGLTCGESRTGIWFLMRTLLSYWWRVCFPWFRLARLTDHHFFIPWPVGSAGRHEAADASCWWMSKSNTDLFRKSKRFHAYDRATSLVRFNHPEQFVSGLCSLCQLCAFDCSKLWSGINDDKCRRVGGTEAVERVSSWKFPWIISALDYSRADISSCFPRKNLNNVKIVKPLKAVI